MDETMHNKTLLKHTDNKKSLAAPHLYQDEVKLLSRVRDPASPFASLITAHTTVTHQLLF